MNAKLTAAERASQAIQAAFKHWSKSPELALMDHEALHREIMEQIQEAATEAREIDHPCFGTGFQAGAEAMREACAKQARIDCGCRRAVKECPKEENIRSLPLPGGEGQ